MRVVKDLASCSSLAGLVTLGRLDDQRAPKFRDRESTISQSHSSPPYAFRQMLPRWWCGGGDAGDD